MGTKIVSSKSVFASIGWRRVPESINDLIICLALDGNCILTLQDPPTSVYRHRDLASEVYPTLAPPISLFLNHLEVTLLSPKGRVMKTIAAAFVVVLLVVSELPLGLPISFTTPAFLWSNSQEEFTTNKVKDAVSYQTLSPKDLAKSVMSEGGWSNLLCSNQKPEQSVDLAIVFIGRESLDISGRKLEDQALLDLLKASFTKSTFSLAYPYVAASEENEALQKSLVSEFAETCGHDAGLSKLGILESCAAEGGNFEKLTDINSVHEYVVSSMEKKSNGQTPLVVFCNGGASSLKGSEQPRSEGQVFSELISSVEQTGAKYSVLYVSDPVNVIRYPSYRQLDRFLAQKSGNESDNSTTCDGVCQIKSSLLEGLLVGLVLLIILISGLCCMAGIDTPTRFEAPQES